MTADIINNLELYKLLFENSNSHMWARDLEGKYLLANRSFADFLSLKKEEIIGKTNFDFLPRKIAEDFKHDDEIVIKKKHATIREISKFYKNENNSFLVVKFPLFDEKNTVYAVAGCVTDISKEKFFWKRLQQKESLLSSVINSMGEGLMFFNAKEKLEFINEEAERIFKRLGSNHLSKELLPTLQFIPLREGRNKKARKHNFLTLILAEEGCEFKDREFQVRGLESIQNLQISMTAIPVRNAEKEKLGMVVTFKDITEQNFLSDTLKKQTQELKLKNEALQQFTYFVSHDLREPLRTINSFIHILQEDLADNSTPSVKRNMKIIREAGLHLNSMFCDLVKLCEIDTHHLMESVNLDTCLKKAINFLRVCIDETQTKIHSISLPFVKGNEASLVLLFQNLIINAIKYQNHSNPEIFITSEKKGGDYIIGVKDNGIGIDQRDAKKIFLPFKRLHSNRAYKGSGIGLAVCKKIIELHSGRIWVESKIGEGSHFKFKLKKAN
jgi:PAS domain S-box-containing protein